MSKSFIAEFVEQPLIAGLINQYGHALQSSGADAGVVRGAIFDQLTSLHAEERRELHDYLDTIRDGCGPRPVRSNYGTRKGARRSD